MVESEVRFETLKVEATREMGLARPFLRALEVMQGMGLSGPSPFPREVKQEGLVPPF